MIKKALTKYLPRRGDLPSLGTVGFSTLAGMVAQDYALKLGNSYADSFMYGISAMFAVFSLAMPLAFLYWPKKSKS